VRPLLQHLCPMHPEAQIHARFGASLTSQGTPLIVSCLAPPTAKRTMCVGLCGVMVFIVPSCGCRLHGANRLGGNSLLECVVFGRIAAQSATDYLASQAASSAPLPQQGTDL
jgi:hypothetical protein